MCGIGYFQVAFHGGSGPEKPQGSIRISGKAHPEFERAREVLKLTAFTTANISLFAINNTYGTTKVSLEGLKYFLIFSLPVVLSQFKYLKILIFIYILAFFPFLSKTRHYAIHVFLKFALFPLELEL